MMSPISPCRAAVVHKPLPHDSARLHVQGSAIYVDDLREPEGTLHVAFGMADKARGSLRGLELAPVRAAPGVVAVLTAADIPGRNDIAPAFADEPLFADKEILFHGQPLFAVVARTRDEARRAARLAKIDIEEQTPSLTVADALKTGERVMDDYAFGRDGAVSAIDHAPYKLEGQLSIGGQEHFYLEGQASFAIPGEGDDMTVHASSQDPTETQHIVARVLGIPDAFVTVETRRMGGGFGGKESQACTWAAMAALAARVTGRPCKVRLDRDDDFMMTGKRHDFRADWRVGFDDRGVIAGYDVMLNARCGCSADLSLGVVDRAMFHAGNGYWLPRCFDRLPPPEDQHGVQHRFPRVRGPAGHDRDRARHGRDRPGTRARSARCPEGQSLASRLRPDAIRAGRRGSGDPEADHRGARGDEPLPRSPRRHRGFQLHEPAHQARDRADAGDVRHFVHAHSPQSGGSARACLFGRLDPPQSRRHGDGAGALHQGRPDRRRGIRRAASLRPHHRDQHFEGPQRVSDRRLLGNRSERDGRQDRRRSDQGTNGCVRRGTMGRQRRRSRVSRRTRVCRQRFDELRRARQGMPHRTRFAVPRGSLQDAGNPLGPRQGARPAVLLLRLRGGVLGGRDR